MRTTTMLASAGLLMLQHSQLAVAAPSRRDTWFCGGNGASWDGTLWGDNGLTQWLTDRVAHYIDTSWPEDVSGVPRTIAEYGGDAGDDHDTMYNWGTACISVDGTCDLGESALKTNAGCEANSQRAFSLWAMRNNARFIQRFYAAMTDIFDTSSLAVADIIVTFIGDGAGETEMGTSAWLIILSGAIGATTAFIPGGGAAIGGTVAGIMGVGIGILNTAKSVPIDPRFTTFADLEARVGDIKIETQNTIGAYFDGLYRNSPPQGDAGAGNALVDVMSSGVWAEQDMAELSFTKEDMIRLVHSSIITEAWNSQSVVIIKWSNGLLNDISGTSINPCWEDPGWAEQGIDVYVACENDKNYMAVRMGDTGVGPWSVQGWDEDSLSKYGLTHKIVIDNSEHRQAMSGEWINRGLDVLADDLAAFASDPPDNIGEASLPFNLPICEFDNIDGLDWDEDECFGIPQVCLANLITKNCPRLLLNDAPFPYDS